MQTPLMPLPLAWKQPDVDGIFVAHVQAPTGPCEGATNVWQEKGCIVQRVFKELAGNAISFIKSDDSSLPPRLGNPQLTATFGDASAGYPLAGLQVAQPEGANLVVSPPRPWWAT